MKIVSRQIIIKRPREYPFFLVLAGQLKNSRYWQGYQRPGAKKSPIQNKTSTERAQKPCLMSLEVHQESDQDVEKTFD